MPDLVVLTLLAVPVIVFVLLWLISVLAPASRHRPPGAFW